MSARIIPVALFLLIIIPARACADAGNNNVGQSTDDMASGLMALAGRGATAVANAAAMGAASQLGIPPEPDDDGGGSDGGGEGGSEGGSSGGGDD